MNHGGERLFINGVQVMGTKSYDIEKYLWDPTQITITLSADVEIVDDEDNEVSE